MQSHIEATAAEGQHLAYQKIPAKARLVVEKNKEGRARFNQMSDQAQVLLQENKALRDLESQLCVEVDILEQQLSAFSRKSCALKKVRGLSWLVMYEVTFHFLTNIQTLLYKLVFRKLFIAQGRIRSI